jgi:hypothetical protein
MQPRAAIERLRLGHIALWLIFLVLLLCTPGLAQRKAGPDSFLRYEVYDVPGLIAELKADPATLARFARHFATSKETILSYFENNLTVSQFPANATVRVWGYSPNAGFYTVAKTFTKGTQVFATKDGTPLLRYKCANPLRKDLPPVLSPPATQASEAPVEEVVKAQPAKAVEPVVEPAATMPTPPETELALATFVPPPVEEKVAGIAQLAFLPAAVTGGGGSLWPLLGVVPIGIAAGGGGGGGAVPEPGLGMIAVLAAWGFAAWRYRRKR